MRSETRRASALRRPRRYGKAPRESNRTGDAATQQTECLIRGTPETTLEVVVRFLQLTNRQVGAFEPPLERWRGGVEQGFHPVETLRLGDKLYQTWQEAEKWAAEQVWLRGATKGL